MHSSKYYIHTAILSTTTVNRFVNWKHHTNGEFTTGWVKPQPPFFPSEEHIESIFLYSAGTWYIQ